MDELLVCTVCIEKYNEKNRPPVLLPRCGHSFCRPCTTMLASGGCVVCPTCRVDQRVDAVERLPTEYTLLAIINAQENSKKEICSQHGVKLSFWCQTCNITACGECLFEDHPIHSHRVIKAAQYIADMKKNVLDITSKFMECLNNKETFLYKNIFNCTKEISQAFQQITVLRKDVEEARDLMRSSREEVKISCAPSVSEAAKFLGQKWNIRSEGYENKNEAKLSNAIKNTNESKPQKGKEDERWKHSDGELGQFEKGSKKISIEKLHYPMFGACITNKKVDSHNDDKAVNATKAETAPQSPTQEKVENNTEEVILTLPRRSKVADSKNEKHNAVETGKQNVSRCENKKEINGIDETLEGDKAKKGKTSIDSISKGSKTVEQSVEKNQQIKKNTKHIEEGPTKNPEKQNMIKPIENGPLPPLPNPDSVVVHNEKKDIVPLSMKNTNEKNIKKISPDLSENDKKGDSKSVQNCENLKILDQIINIAKGNVFAGGEPKTEKDKITNKTKASSEKIIVNKCEIVNKTANIAGSPPPTLKTEQPDKTKVTNGPIIDGQFRLTDNSVDNQTKTETNPKNIDDEKKPLKAEKAIESSEQCPLISESNIIEPESSDNKVCVPDEFSNTKLSDCIQVPGFMVVVEGPNGSLGALSWDSQGRLYAHSFQMHLIEFDILIKGHLLNAMIPSRSPMVFLEFSTEKTIIGKVYIELWGHLKRSHNFLTLCLGDRGHSYLFTKFLKVFNVDEPGERILGGDYEHNNGNGGKGIIEDLESDNVYSLPMETGMVTAAGVNQEGTNSHFLICTDGDPTRKFACPFGKVSEGLKYVKEGIRLTATDVVSITDCGVLLVPPKVEN